MDTNVAAQEPTTTKQAEALGYAWTDWEVAYDMWTAKGELKSHRKSFPSENRFYAFMEKQEQHDNFHAWRGTRRPSAR